MSGRSNVRDKILATASRLFFEEGTRAVGIDRIIAEADIAKASLYHHFPSKEELVHAYLLKRHEVILASIGDMLEGAGGTPQERILRLFDALEYKVEHSDVFRGCAFLLAVAENEESDPIRAAARLHKSSILGIFRALASEITEEAGPLGEELALCYEGALATVAVGRNPAAVQIAKRSAATLIRAYLPGQS